MSVIIREKETGTVLAKGEIGAEAIKYEGNLYFDPSAVESGVLQVTERIYTCPVKGIANWVDFIGPGGSTTRNVAWVYPEPHRGHELIRGRYGFYVGNRGATVQGEE